MADYNPQLDKVLWSEDCIEEGMRVTAHSYDGKAAKFSLTQIYADRQSGNICVGTYTTRDGQRKDKTISRLSVAQLVRLHHLVQNKIQEGQV
jgi:hypothetical protein